MDIVRGVESTLACSPPRLIANGGNGCRDTFHVSFDPADEDVIEVLVRTVAVIHNTDPTTLSAIGEVVDPDALRAIFGREPDRFTTEAQATFVYEGLEVTINTDGNVWLEWV